MCGEDGGRGAGAARSIKIKVGQHRPTNPTLPLSSADAYIDFMSLSPTIRRSLVCMSRTFPCHKSFLGESRACRASADPHRHEEAHGWDGKVRFASIYMIDTGSLPSAPPTSHSIAAPVPYWQHRLHCGNHHQQCPPRLLDAEARRSYPRRCSRRRTKSGRSCWCPRSPQHRRRSCCCRLRSPCRSRC